MENNIRPPKFADTVYAGDPTVLRQDIEAFIGLEPLDGLPPPNAIRVLKSPHIDYYRGYRSYGRAFQQMKGGAFDLIFLIGTAHQGSRRLFHGTTKSFSTPLGVHRTDEEIVRNITELYGARFLEEEHLHEDEHSLELQLPFLSIAVGMIPIVPILVGGLHPMFGKGLPPQFEIYEAFIQAMLSILAELDKKGKRYCFVAGVDMAHVGRYFGDEGSVTDAQLKEIEERDLQYLGYVAALDALALYEHAATDFDARRICGHATMVTICDILQRRSEKLQPVLTAYQQCFNPENDCCVTIAGMGLYTA